MTSTPLRRIVEAELLEDYVGLWWMVRAAQGVTPNPEHGSVQVSVLELVRTLLEEHVCVVGQFKGDQFQPWEMNNERAIQRIVQAWSALGRDPDIGEIAWLKKI